MRVFFWRLFIFVVQANLAEAITIEPDAFDPAEGMLIKGPARPHVYQVFGGRKHWIPNPPTFNNLYTTWAAIRVVPASSVGIIPTGPPYSNGARLVRCPGFPHIFLQTNGQKRWCVAQQQALGSGLRRFANWECSFLLLSGSATLQVTTSTTSRGTKLRR